MDFSDMQDEIGQEITLVVHGSITAMEDGTWKGVLFTPPFADAECTADSVTGTRRALARHVLKRVGDQVLPMPASSVAAVRLHTTTERRYLRGGEITPTEIYVHTRADKWSDAWHAQTTTGAGMLYPEVGEGADFASACDDLAAKLMMAMEVGVEGVAQDWSALRLLVSSRKTFSAAQLQDA